MMKIHCPNCGKKLNVPERLVGKQGKCPKCGDIIPIIADSEDAFSSIPSSCLVVEDTEKTHCKKCPYCAEEIKQEAIICRFCGKDIDDVFREKTYRCSKCGNALVKGKDHVCSNDNLDNEHFSIKNEKEEPPTNKPILSSIFAITIILFFLGSSYNGLVRSGLIGSYLNGSYSSSHWEELGGMVKEDIETYSEILKILNPKDKQVNIQETSEIVHKHRNRIVSIRDDISNITVGNMSDLNSFSAARTNAELSIGIQLEAISHFLQCSDNTLDRYKRKAACDIGLQLNDEVFKSMGEVTVLLDKYMNN